MGALSDEHGKASSTRWAGLLLVGLFVAVVVANVWWDKPVAEVVYETLEVLILALVAGIATRGLTKTVSATRAAARSVTEHREEGER